MGLVDVKSRWLVKLGVLGACLSGAGLKRVLLWVQIL